MTRYPVATAVRPTTVQPLRMTCLLFNTIIRIEWGNNVLAPVSHTRCRTPLIEWNAKGKAKKDFIPNFAATGSDPNAAAILATSKCHPNRGETRYAAPKQYRPNMSGGRHVIWFTAREDSSCDTSETTEIPSDLRLVDTKMWTNRTMFPLGCDDRSSFSCGDGLGGHRSELTD